MIKWFGWQENPKPKPHKEVGLPPSVMMDLHANPGAVLHKENVQRLVRDGSNEPTHLANAAIYLLMKEAAEDSDGQRELIEGAVAALKEVPAGEDEKARQALRTYAEGVIKNLPEDWTVGARNLNRLNRAGFDYWDDRYANKARELATDGRPVFLVGNSAFLGLTSFVRSFREAGKDLHILMPSYMSEGEEARGAGSFGNHPCGYVISPDGQVRGLPPNFERPANAVIVDDVRNTGKTEDRIKEFWMRTSNDEPIFEPLDNSGGAVV
ncbi:MAG: hypothetical protein KBD05_02260 [Candidatus Pacebacteria bacterium]|nr:hypothetical protein [Candidatus Paceibacterota bacterium]